MAPPRTDIASLARCSAQRPDSPSHSAAPTKVPSFSAFSRVPDWRPRAFAVCTVTSFKCTARSVGRGPRSAPGRRLGRQAQRDELEGPHAPRVPPICAAPLKTSLLGAGRRGPRGASGSRRPCGVPVPHLRFARPQPLPLFHLLIRLFLAHSPAPSVGGASALLVLTDRDGDTAPSPAPAFPLLSGRLRARRFGPCAATPTPLPRPRAAWLLGRGPDVADAFSVFLVKCFSVSFFR